MPRALRFLAKALAVVILVVCIVAVLFTIAVQAVWAWPASAAVAPPPPGQFAGKFELVPLFDKGLPVIRNGHAFYALRNPVAFTTRAGRVLTAPAGMTTDLASIPQAAWWLLPPDGPWAKGATIHDDCYRTRGTFVWVWPVPKAAKPGAVRKTFVGLAGPALTRAQCDEVLREAMVALGVPAWKRVSIYEAVRVGGGAGWGH